MATLDFSSMADPEAAAPKATPAPPTASPAGPVAEATVKSAAPAAAEDAGLPQDQPEPPKPDGSIFSKDLFSAAADDLIKAPLAGIERAGRGLYDTGRAIADVAGIKTPALGPPYFEEPKAFPAQLLTTATQFGIGWVAGGAITKGLGVAAKLGTIGNEVAAQGIGTALVADPHAPNLSNLVEQFPVLKNPVTDYLSAKGDDSIAFGKFKAAVQDMAAQVPLSLITKVVRGMKAEKVGDVKTADLMKSEVSQEVGLTPKVVEPEVKPTVPLGETATKPTVAEVKNAAGEPAFTFTKEQSDLFESQFTARTRPLANAEGNEDGTAALYGSINFSKMDGPDTVKQVFSDISNIYDRALNKSGNANSARITENEQIKLATLLGKEPAQALADIHHLAASADRLAPAILAARGMAESIAVRMRSIGTKINTESHTLDDLHELATLKQTFTDLFSSTRALQSGTARATQSGNVRTNRLYEMPSLMEDGGGIDGLIKFGKRLALADDNTEALAVMNTSWGRKLLDSHNEFWINSVLSGVKTNVVNVSSNTINTLAAPTNMIVGGAIRRDTQGIKDGIALYRGLSSQFNDSAALAWKAFKTDTAILDPGKGTNEMWGRAISSANYDISKVQGKPEKFLAYGVDFLGKVIRFPSRFLTAEDEFFKQINYRAKLKVNASNEAEDLVSAGKLDRTGVEKYVEGRFQSALSPAQQDKNALTYAQQATFTQPLRDIETHDWFGNIGASVQAAASSHPIIRGTILPFIKVPTNIMRSAVDHSLLATATKRFHVDLAAGGERANLAVGRLATGTLLGIGASVLAVNGHITGAAYGDKDMQARQRESGWQPYSFTNGPQAGKDQWFVSLSRLDPWGTTFGLVGDFAQTAQHLDEGSRHNFATVLSLSIANNIASKGYLMGLVEISSLMGSGYSKEHAVERFIQQRVGSYIPAGVGVAASLWSGDADTKSLRHWYDGALAKIPGYSKTVETRRDYLTGEKTVAPDGYPWNALNPFTVSRGKGNVVRDELKRLTLSSAESKFVPPDARLGTIDLASIKNARGQSAYDRWTELIGQVKVHGKTFEENLHDLMHTGRYTNGTDGTSYYGLGSRPAMIKAERKNHEDLAQRTMLKEFTNARDADGAPVDLRLALQTDARNKTAERLGKADKIQDISNLQK